MPLSEWLPDFPTLEHTFTNLANLLIHAPGIRLRHELQLSGEHYKHRGSVVRSNVLNIQSF